MKHAILVKCALAVLSTVALAGCGKYLNEKSDSKLVVPSRMEDLQAQLDYTQTMTNRNPFSPIISADNIYLQSTDYDGLRSEYEKNMYVWAGKDLFPVQANDWYYCAVPIYTANSVIQSLSLLTDADSTTANDIRGQALFHRAKNFFHMLTVWSLAFDSTSAGTDLGIPLRLDPDFNIPSVRASVWDSYMQVIADLETAAGLLPAQPVHVVRPSRPAAYGLLSRVYLSMRNYEKALETADSALAYKSELLDYNTLSTARTYPFVLANAETVFYSVIPATYSTLRSVCRMDTALVALYAAGDLRRTFYFNTNSDGSFWFRGNYTGSASQFGGIATDEIWLTKAECHARRNEVTEALTALNTLLANRYRTGSFVPLATHNPQILLDTILQERRKELPMRGIRWMDIKRLNKEEYGIALKRVINGTEYTLPPNDPRFALPIPEDVISLSGMQQNPQ